MVLFGIYSKYRLLISLYSVPVIGVESPGMPEV